MSSRSNKINQKIRSHKLPPLFGGIDKRTVAEKAKTQHGVAKQAGQTTPLDIDPTTDDNANARSKTTNKSESSARPPHQIDLSEMDDESQQVTSITTEFPSQQRVPAKRFTVSGRITECGTKTVLKEAIRDDLFRYMKFPDKFYDYDFTTKPETICGTILRHAEMLDNATREQWWKESKQLVVKTYTDYRNNCIKNIKYKYKGT
jgi:hypothetical protein